MSSSKPALTTDKTLFQEILIVMESYNLLFFLKKKVLLFLFLCFKSWLCEYRCLHLHPPGAGVRGYLLAFSKAATY